MRVVSTTPADASVVRARIAVVARGAIRTANGIAGAERAVAAAGICARVHRAIELIVAVSGRRAISGQTTRAGGCVARFVRAGVAVIRATVAPGLSAIKGVLAAADRITTRVPLAGYCRTNVRHINATSVGSARIVRTRVVVVARRAIGTTQASRRTGVRHMLATPKRPAGVVRASDVIIARCSVGAANAARRA